MLNKLLGRVSSLEHGLFFVQKEAAMRYMGRPETTQISLLSKMYYDLDIYKELDSNDFSPIPSVDIVVLEAKRSSKIEGDPDLYEDFVTYVFNQRNPDVAITLKKLFTFNQFKHIRAWLNTHNVKKPSQIPEFKWLEMFKYMSTSEKSLSKVKGFSKKNKYSHQKRTKVHRKR